MLAPHCRPPFRPYMGTRTVPARLGTRAISLQRAGNAPIGDRAFSARLLFGNSWTCPSTSKTTQGSPDAVSISDPEGLRPRDRSKRPERFEAPGGSTAEHAIMPAWVAGHIRAIRWRNPTKKAPPEGGAF